MRLKDALNNMFSFIWTQPIHVTLRQMRFVHIAIIISSQWLLFKIVGKLSVLDPVQAAIAYGAIAAAIIAAIWKGIDGLHKPNVKDNQ